MPDSSTKTITRRSRWAFFKGRPGASFPLAHSVLITLDGALVGLLRAETQCAQYTPYMRRTEPHAVESLNDSAHPLECPQLGSKPMFCRTLQDDRSYRGQLPLIQLGRSASLGHCTQRINSAFIKQRLPCVYSLARHAHRQRNLGATLALLQHPPSSQPLLRRLAQPLLYHPNILQ